MEMYTEAITLLDPAREQIIIFALHEAKEREAESRTIFRKIVSTVTLWEPDGS